jgi:hypothetical protein
MLPNEELYCRPVTSADEIYNALDKFNNPKMFLGTAGGEALC